MYHAGAPLQRVHIDILGPFSPPRSAGHQYVVMMVDQFTKWLECFPVARQTAEVVARVFVDGFVSRFGSPLEVHTDQGKQFEGNLFKAISSRDREDENYTLPTLLEWPSGEIQSDNPSADSLLPARKLGHFGRKPSSFGRGT